MKITLLQRSLIQSLTSCSTYDLISHKGYGYTAHKGSSNDLKVVIETKALGPVGEYGFANPDVHLQFTSCRDH